MLFFSGLVDAITGEAMVKTIDSTHSSKDAAIKPRNCDVLVIGNSHTTAIAHAVKVDSARDVIVVNNAVDFDPVNRKNKTIKPELKDMYSPAYIFATFGGSEHNVFGLIEAPTPFDFVTPRYSDFDPRRTFVSYSAILSTLEVAMMGAIANLEAICRLFDRPVIQICTPPPFRNMDETVRLPRVFQDRLAAGIAPPELRRKLHALHSDILAKHCARLGIRMIPPPPEAVDADGFLLDQLWTTDPTHGNADYGRLVLKQIREFIHVEK